MFDKLREQLIANPRTIVFTEGEDARILEAASKLSAEKALKCILLGTEEGVKAAAAAGGFNIEGCEIIDPACYAEIEEMAQCMFDLRKGKMAMEDVRANLARGNYFGTMLVKMGKADCLLGGAT